jgi:hypothetical protein
MTVGRLLPRLPAAPELAAVIAYALLSWAVYQWLIMPWLAPTMNGNTSALPMAVAHVVFALGFAAWWIPRTARSRTLPNQSTETDDRA